MSLQLTTKFLILTTSFVGSVATSIPLLISVGKQDKEIRNTESSEVLIVQLRQRECEQQRNRQKADKNFWNYWKSGASHYLRQSYEECMDYSSKNKIEKTKSKEEIMTELRNQECKRQQNLQQSDKNFWSHWGNFASHYLKQSYGECMSYKEENT